MEIAKIFAQSKQMKSETQQFPESKDSDFGKYITKAEEDNKRSQTVNPKNADKRPQKANPVNKKPSKAKPGAGIDNAQQTQKVENGGAAPEKEATATETAEVKTADQKATDVSPLAGQETNALESAAYAFNSGAAAQLADKLNVSPEEITELLEKLGIQPADLLNKDNLSNFVREFFGAETNLDLLNVAKAGDVFALVKEVVSDIPVSAETLINVPEPAEETVKPELAVVNTGAEPIGKALTDTGKPVTGGEAVSGRQASQLTEAEAQTAAQTGEGEPESQNADGNRETKSGGSLSTDTVNVKPAAAQTSVSEYIDEEGALIASGQTTGGDARVVRTEMKPAAASALNTADVVKQITEHIKTEVTNSSSEVKMLLKPESLGELELKISIQNGIVTAQFTAENQRVKEIIESNFNELKNALSESGVSVGSLSVSVSNGNENENEAMRAYERERQKSAKRISKIIGGLNFAEASQPESVSEGDVLDARVNLTV